MVCSVVNSIQWVWKCSSLSINTKVHLYQALIMSELLYGAETRTFLVADTGGFHVMCQRQILDIRWWSHASNASAIWFVNHWWHLTSSTIISVWSCCTPGPWSTSTRCSASDEGRKPMASWRRHPGRPRNVWLNKIQRSTAVYAVEIWDRQGSRSGATIHSDYATTTMMIYRILTTVCQSVAKVPIRT